MSYHYSELSVLEGMLARGDRKLADLLEEVHNSGCMFDSWDEFFDKDKWDKAFFKLGIDRRFYSERFFDLEDNLYWDHIDLGVKKSYLWNEYQKSKEQNITKDCRLGCTGCGVCVDDIKMDIKGQYRG